MMCFKSISYNQKKPTTLVLLNQAILDNYRGSYSKSDSPSPHLPTLPTLPSLSLFPTPYSLLPTPLVTLWFSAGV